jgi:hypothetical protein
LLSLYALLAPVQMQPAAVPLFTLQPLNGSLSLLWKHFVHNLLLHFTHHTIIAY